MSMVTLYINGLKVSVESGQTVLDAAYKLGIDIPTLCHSEHLLPFGACRLCTVEVGKGEHYRLQASCAYPAEDGLEVKTDTERVIRGRKLMAELLLARAPQVEAVKRIAADLGVTKSRFTQKDETCILCGKCVRFCEEIVGASAISFVGRGISKKVQTPYEELSDQCIACGACTFICPTGHIQMESDTRQHWAKYLASYSRQCRFTRMGFFSYKICPNNFRCETCEVDQQMEDMLGTHPTIAIYPASQHEPVWIAEFKFVPALHYTQGHVWSRFTDGTIKLGIDDFMRAVVHRVDRLHVPSSGTKFGAGEVLWELESGNKRLPIISPLTGRIISTNPYLEVDPSLVSREPFGRGWIAMVQPENQEELEACRSRLMTGRVAQSWLSEEAERIYAWSDPGSRHAVAESGHLGEDLPAHLDDQQWRALIANFFG